MKIDLVAKFFSVLSKVVLPKDHVVFYLSKKFGVPENEAREKWFFAKKKATKPGKPTNYYEAIELFEKVAKDKSDNKGKSALHIPKRDLSPSNHSQPISVPRNIRGSLIREIAKINVFRRPHHRHLKMDREHLLQRLRRKFHKPTRLEKLRRLHARRLWKARNASALRRRQSFLKHFRKHHGHN